MRSGQKNRSAPRVTYKLTQEYVEKKYGFKIHTAYVAEEKREWGLSMYDAPNAVEGLKQLRKHPTAEQKEAIKDVFKFCNYTGRNVNGFI